MKMKNIKNLLAVIALSATVVLGQLFAFSALSSLPVHAQNQAQQLCEGSGGTFAGGECKKTGEVGLFDENGLFNNIINAIIFLVGAISVVMLIIGGVRYVVSAGDSNAVQGAKNTILYAVIGIIVAAAAFGIVNFVINQLSTGP